MRPTTPALSASVMGTRYYMAPEPHDAGSRIDGRADQHALAIPLYEMVTGTLPVVEDATLGDTPTAPTAFAPRVGDALRIRACVRGAARFAVSRYRASESGIDRAARARVVPRTRRVVR